MENQKLLLTIVIPFYNGADKINTILNNLFVNYKTNYEILIIDDFSEIQQSEKLENLIKNKYNNGNLRYLKNNSNIGMDLNFEKCIVNSNSNYIWFFGQDDYVTKVNLEICINLLIVNNPDIVFANYTINRSWNYNTTYIFSKNKKVITGFGVTNFLKYNEKKLPSFLPSLIIKKNNWPNNNIISNFYGTHFIQLAAFLYNLSLEKKWLYIGTPLAVGEIPSNGWQNSLENRIKYYIGFFTCLEKLNKLDFKNFNLILNEQHNANIIQHLFLSIECKISYRVDLLHKLKDTILFSKKNILMTNIVHYIPTKILIFIYNKKKFYYSFKNIYNSKINE
jgi:glycosyltransferase involved in cell wall biosynthesis